MNYWIKKSAEKCVKMKERNETFVASWFTTKYYWEIARFIFVEILKCQLAIIRYTK